MKIFLASLFYTYTFNFKVSINFSPIFYQLPIDFDFVGGKRCGQSPLETIVVEGKRLKVSKYIKALSTSSEVDTIPTPLPSRQHQQHSSGTCL